MKLSIHIIFVVAAIIRGYQCSGCFGSDKYDEFLDVTCIFHPAQNYAIRKHNLESIYTGFKTSIENVMKSLKGVKTEYNAGELLALLHSNFHEFSIWVRNIRDMENTIVTEFVNSTINADKKFISDNKKVLKKCKMAYVIELKEILLEHAAALIKHHSDINQNIGLLAREMTYRKTVVDWIANYIAKNGTTPETLKAILDTVNPRLFQATTNMEVINQSMSECIAHKNTLKPTEKLGSFLQRALLSISKPGRK
ncbi:uncharacterized protein LOC116341323 [Contarinia nasturtii]|uniref:uncharacterized protein LOC116341323 n=1 Tax=Contarinia nasturtii TaxID=265458 RepID=UPI0012D48529|nr:uncharacterized protein LOC116341323 [Contarinia nasturtii]